MSTSDAAGPGPASAGVPLTRGVGWARRYDARMQARTAPVPALDEVTLCRVRQVNVSSGGVPKLPVPVARVGRLGLEGDDHADRTEHGGPFRAVCLYSIEAIERVRAEGHPIFPGSVGENLTLEGVELGGLRTGDRLAVGDEVVLEITTPALPCDTIRASFTDGRIARISVLTHPVDTRLYARVLREGAVRPGDRIRVLPALPDSDARTHALLNRVDAIERASRLSEWRAAADGGVDVRLLDDGELCVAATPSVRDPNFNTALGLRQLDHLLPEVLEFLAAHTTVAWLDLAEPPWPGAHAESTGSVLAGDAGSMHAALGSRARPDGFEVRKIAPDEAVSWERTVLAGFGLSGAVAAAWLAAVPGIARDHRWHLFVAELDGAPVGAAGMFVHRGAAALGPGSVMPAFRGRGVHVALIAARLGLALELGCDLAAAWARQDGPSERNLRRLGLDRIWTVHSYRWERDAAPAGGESPLGDETWA